MFLSYRQTNTEQKKRVRAFGERLRRCGINVTLDQFLKDENPGGPDEGWDKWSSKGVLQADYVLIIGTKEWFECFEGTQPPGTGLGAACEADDIRHLIYKSAGVIKNIRVVLFDDADAVHIPAKLDRYERFHAERDFADIVRWLGGKLPRGRATKVNPMYATASVSSRKRAKLHKEDNPFQTAGALRHDHGTYIRRLCDDEFERCICGSNSLISIIGEFGIGKSSLMQQARRILTDYHFFGGGLADLGGHDERLFMRNFFRLFGKRFGSISEWDELEDHVSQCPSVLFLDDIGEVASPGLGALIPALVERVTQHAVKLRVIATSPQPLQAVFADRGLRNPKYSKPWTRISISACNNAAARELLQLLPDRSRAIAIDRIQVVEGISELAPQRLQRLCSRLFDGECDGLTDEELLSLVGDSASYE